MRKSPTHNLAETERVMDGDHVVCLREEGESVWVHTDAGVQGFIGRGHLHVKRTVKRADGARATGLCEAASHAGEDGDVRVAVSTAVANGDEVVQARRRVCSVPAARSARSVEPARGGSTTALLRLRTEATFPPR